MVANCVGDGVCIDPKCSKHGISPWNDEFESPELKLMHERELSRREVLLKYTGDCGRLQVCTFPRCGCKLRNPLMSP